jgi:hypothetical protein
MSESLDRFKFFILRLIHEEWLEIGVEHTWSRSFLERSWRQPDPLADDVHHARHHTEATAEVVLPHQSTFRQRNFKKLYQFQKYFRFLFCTSYCARHCLEYLARHLTLTLPAPNSVFPKLFDLADHKTLNKTLADQKVLYTKSTDYEIEI